MGRLESEVYIGAVALGSIIFNIIYWGFGFLRMGTTGLTAQSFGQEDRKECMAILGRGLLFALGGSVFILALQSLIAWLGFSLLQGDEAIKTLATQYFYIRIYAAPATLGLYVFHGWFLGMQNARSPMVLTIFVNLLNIVFNIIFVLQMGMKADGVALGTVCAQYLGLALAVGIFFAKYRPYVSLFERRQIFRLAAIKRFFAINIDIFIRTVCLVFTFAFFTSASAGINSLTLAANQILLQYISLMSYAVDGFAFAAESLVGRYVGAKDSAHLKKSIQYLFYWGVGFGTAFALAYGMAGKTLLRIFTDQIEIIHAAAPFVWWVVAISLAGSVAYMWDGVYIGATVTNAMRNMMLIATVAVFLPTYYLTISGMGNHGLWLALLLFMVARGLTLALLAKRHILSP
jgi:MATE family multidrug resistance protein